MWWRLPTALTERKTEIVVRKISLASKNKGSPTSPQYSPPRKTEKRQKSRWKSPPHIYYLVYAKSIAQCSLAAIFAK
jgi:hypothetical protein